MQMTVHVYNLELAMDDTRYASDNRQYFIAWTVSFTMKQETKYKQTK